VFGGTDGGWFKMRSVDAAGKLRENRHTKAVWSIDKLTVAIWEAANRGGDYSVTDIKRTSGETTTVLMPTAEYCPIGRGVRNSEDCQTAFNRIKASNPKINNRRPLQDGNWQGVPYGCSIQMGNAGDAYYEDYSAHWNAKSDTNNARATTGEFRVICAGAPQNVIFVTEATHDGNFGGHEGAAEFCASEAAKVKGLPTTWCAMLGPNSCYERNMYPDLSQPDGSAGVATTVSKNQRGLTYTGDFWYGQNPTCDNWSSASLSTYSTTATNGRISADGSTSVDASFSLTINAAISGHNKEHMSGTVDECKAACLDLIWCKSIDYYKIPKRCDLSDKSASDVVGGLNTNYGGNPYDHYSLERPCSGSHPVVCVSVQEEEELVGVPLSTRRSSTPDPYTTVAKIDHERGYKNLYDEFGMIKYAASFGRNTIWRLRCWDSDANGLERTMYLSGLDSPNTAFDAGTIVDTTFVQCASNPRFSNSAYGKDCLSHNDVSYWHLTASKGDVKWAKFKPLNYGAQTLRHCGHHGTGTFSPGEIAFYNDAGQKPIDLLNFGGLSSPPSHDWHLALNIDTSDGHLVAYHNVEFWESAFELGGATSDRGQALKQDYKNPEVFSTLKTNDILIVVHDKSIVLGWRQWHLDGDAATLQNFFF